MRGCKPSCDGQVDQFHRLAHAAHRGLDHCSWLPGNGHHRAVVVRIHRPVQKLHALDPHRGHNGFDTPGVRALREVWNALDYRVVHLPSFNLRASNARFMRGCPVYFQNVYPTCT